MEKKMSNSTRSSVYPSNAVIPSVSEGPGRAWGAAHPPRFLATLGMTLVVLAACAASVAPNKYGLQVVPDRAAYEKLAARDPEQRLIDLSTIPGVRIDVRYATTNNFMHEQLY